MIDFVYTPSVIAYSVSFSCLFNLSLYHNKTFFFLSSLFIHLSLSLSSPLFSLQLHKPKRKRGAMTTHCSSSYPGIVLPLLFVSLLLHHHIALAAFLFPFTTTHTTSTQQQHPLSTPPKALSDGAHSLLLPGGTVNLHGYDVRPISTTTSAHTINKPNNNMYATDISTAYTTLGHGMNLGIYTLPSTITTSSDFHVPSSMSSLSSAFVSPNTLHLPSSSSSSSVTRSHVQLPTATMIEPYINLFIPTYRCSAYFFCRAVLTAYHNRATGRMNIMAGYTIFSVKYSNRGIPRATRRRVLRTTRMEIIRYVKLLGRQLMKDMPGLCEFGLGDGVKAMTKAIRKMKQCRRLDYQSCNRYAFVGAC